MLIAKGLPTDEVKWDGWTAMYPDAERIVGGRAFLLVSLRVRAAGRHTGSGLTEWLGARIAGSRAGRASPP